MSGDLDTALRLGDGMLGAADAETRAAGAAIAATVLAHRGELARSAELYHWAGRADAFAATALVGTGDLDGARRLLDSPAPGVAPTLFAGAATRMARGIVDSVSGCATETLSTLLGAAAMLEPALGGTLLPDSPAALAALAALHTGELALAEPVLTRALDGGIGGDLLSVRHRLLLGWVAMTAGDLATAAEHRDAVAGPTLEARDELFFATLELGLARRASDLVGLQRSWNRAYQASMRQQTDLFTLLPLGELAIAAARTGAFAKISGQLERAHGLLARLGEPPLWTVSLVWHELHAAITLEDADAAKAHLATLATHAHCGRYPSALATAARVLAVGPGRHVRPGRDHGGGGRAARPGPPLGRGPPGRPGGDPHVRPQGDGPAPGGGPPVPGNGGPPRPGHLRNRRRATGPGGAERARARGGPLGGGGADVQAGGLEAVHLGQDGGAPHGPDPREAGGGRSAGAARDPAGAAFPPGRPLRAAPALPGGVPRPVYRWLPTKPGNARP